MGCPKGVNCGGTKKKSSVSIPKSSTKVVRYTKVTVDGKTYNKIIR